MIFLDRYFRLSFKFSDYQPFKIFKSSILFLETFQTTKINDLHQKVMQIYLSSLYICIYSS